jgi:hypothetical protein
MRFARGTPPEVIAAAEKKWLDSTRNPKPKGNQGPMPQGPMPRVEVNPNVRPMPSPNPRPVPGPGRTPNPFTVDARPIGPGGMNPVPRPGMPGSATGPTPNIGGFPVNDRGTGSTPTPKTRTPNDGGTLGPGSQSVARGVELSRNMGLDNPVADANRFVASRANQVGSMANQLFGRAFKKGGPVKKPVGGKVAAKPVTKKASGKVAAKPMGKPVMKKAGGRVAAKPMAKGRKK